jgi:hypothetical protein
MHTLTSEDEERAISDLRIMLRTMKKNRNKKRSQQDRFNNSNKTKMQDGWII